MEWCQYQEANEVLCDALRYNKFHVNCLLNLGNLFKILGFPDEAEREFRKVTHIDNSSAKAFQRIATLLHEENQIDKAFAYYSLALKADHCIDSCAFHLRDVKTLRLSSCLDELYALLSELLKNSSNFARVDLLLFQCLCDFLSHQNINVDMPLISEWRASDLDPCHSVALDDLLEVYVRCRKVLLPRWMCFKDLTSPLLMLSDYLESLRVKCGSQLEGWLVLKEFQLSLTSSRTEGLPCPDQLFVNEKDRDDDLWLRAERFQFPDMTAALSLNDSLLQKSTLPAVNRKDQSEFFRKSHLLDAQKFYMADDDPCLHGVSELYRVHGLIADTIRDIEGLQSIVDLGYYSCGIFNAGLKPGLKRYCIEPARHHALWVEESGAAEVVPDVPARCVRSFDEYLSRLELVSLNNSGPTVAVISFIMQLFEYEQCEEIPRMGFATYLVVTDDILNEDFGRSVLRLLSNGKRMNLCHNYQRLLSDAGWQIDKKVYFHGVRYASGIIVSSAA